MFSFYPKKSRTRFKKTPIIKKWLVVDNFPNIFNLLPIGLKYIFSFEWLDTDLKCVVAVMPIDQPPNSRLVYEIFPFLKRTKHVVHYLDLLIEHYRGTEKKGRVQLGMYFLSQLAFQGVRKFTFSLRWSKI